MEILVPSRQVVTRLLLTGMILVATALLLVRGPTHDFGDGWWADGVGSLLEALLVAGILGLSVDYVLKVALVRDVARLALHTIFGSNAPQEYVNLLQANLEKIQLVHIRATWVVTLDWHEDGKVVKVTGEVDTDSTNVSSTPYRERNLWVVHSAEGAPESRYEAYRVAIRTPATGNRAGSTYAESYDAADLQPMAARRVDGGREVDVDDLGIPPTAPGGHRSETIKATTYQASTGSFPLVNSGPCISSTFRIRGSALRDLDVGLYQGGELLRPIERPDGVSVIHYSYGFTYPRSTFRLEWIPKQMRGDAVRGSNQDRDKE